ncbi:MAG: tetratricopeptide repeat protein [Lentisphaerae bacterium]|nr:tetratricopeptide repeat protein [Lentisphaerota bacterium]
MMNIGKTCCIIAIAGLCGLAAGYASAQTFDDMAMSADEAMKAGNYQEAIRLYEQIAERGATYENIMSVKFDLGWAYYLVGSYAKAIPLFEDLSGVRAPSEAMKQQSIYLMAECHARLADTQDEKSPERKKNIETSIELHTQLQRDFPDGLNTAQSLYGRAYAYYLDSQFDKAKEDLKAVITRFRNTATANDAYYLLASVYSQQALNEIRQGRREAAMPHMEQAREIFSQLSKQQGNLAMANDSMFSLAETWFSAGLYPEAIQYFREVRSKADVMQSLRKIQEDLQARFGAMLARREDTRQVQNELSRVQAQIAAVSEAPDRMLSAYLRIADAFYRMQRYDEVRVICRHLLQFAEGEQQLQAHLIMVNTYIEERDPFAAAAEFERFQQSFGTDAPIAESVSMAIGQIFMAKDDLENALQHLARSIMDYPESKTVEDALFLKFTAEYMLQEHAATIATVDQYAEKFTKGKYLPTGLYYKGMSQDELGDTEAALATMTDVLDRFPKPTEHFTNVDEVAFRKGILLLKAGKSEEAISHFQDYIGKYQDNAMLRSHAMYQLGVALNAADRFEEARQVLRQISTDHPDEAIAPTAMFQIGVMYFEKEQFEEMAKLMNELLEIHADKPIATDAYFWLGWIANRDNDYVTAAEKFRKAWENDKEGPRAAASLFAMAQSLSEQASAMGLPTVLPEAQRNLFREIRLDSARAYEDLLAMYPDYEQAPEGIDGIAKNIFELVRYKQISEEKANDYFQEAAARQARQPPVQAQILFGYGNYLMQNRQQSEALKIFSKALETYPNVQVSPEMLANYAEALKDAGELQESESIYVKLIENNADNQHALAPAWFGLAEIKYLQEQYDLAKQYFEKVLDEFPWYERGRQGRVKLAMILERQQDYAAAEKMFTEVWGEERGEARIGAMLGVARSQLALAERARRAGASADWQNNVRVASENLTKITVLFEAYPVSNCGDWADKLVISMESWAAARNGAASASWRLPDR